MIQYQPSSVKSDRVTDRTLRILLVDDRQLVKAKLQEMLFLEIDLEIVGTASDGETAISQVQILQPDVVLIDIEMPKMDGLEACSIISQRFPSCKILILSDHEKENYIQKAIVAGADGYIFKTIQTEELVTAIRAVYRGYSYFGSQLLKKVGSVLDTAHSAGITQIRSSSPSDLATESSIVKLPKLDLAIAEDLLPSVSKWSNWGAISIVAIVILAIPISAFFKYKTVVKAPIIARPDKELHLVQAALAGQITEILVEEGQEVKQGETIATVDVSHLEMRKNQIIEEIHRQKLELDQIETQISNLFARINAQTEANQASIIAANLELAAAQRSYKDKNVENITLLEELQAQMQAVSATFEKAKARYNRYQSIVKAGAISQERIAEAELEVERQQQELEIVRTKLKRATALSGPSTIEIEISQQQIEQIEQSGQVSTANLEQEQKTLVRQKINIEKQIEIDNEELKQVYREISQARITATDIGTIFQLNLQNSWQTVQVGQEIARIIPKDFQIEMKATVLPQDINKLEVGQKVQMRVSACPYPDYGILSGKVIRIAKDTSKSISHSSDQAHYEVIVAPQTNTFGRDERLCRLKIGMEGQANIIFRSETILQFFLRKARLVGNT